MTKNKQVYMDYSSASPVDPRVLDAMMPYFNEDFGNPTSIHPAGRSAKTALESARASVAELVGAPDSKNILFTSCATESNNLALKGAALRYKSKGNHIITTSVEHMSVMNPLKSLQRNGFEITHVPVDSEGMLNVEKIKSEITDKTILISVMYANGEFGTIQPIQEIGKIASDKGIVFHVDGTAACGKVPINVENDNIDLLTISSNDIYGPKGVGALYVKHGVGIMPSMLGGGQEYGMRSGSENIPGIVGMGKAAELAKNEMGKEGERLTRLRDKLIDALLKMDYTFLTGHRTQRLPNIASIRFSFIEGESIILGLSARGITASTGSACSSKTLEPSNALLALGLKHEDAHGSLLLTLGKYNTEDDVDYIVECLPEIVDRLRKLSPLYPGK